MNIRFKVNVRPTPMKTKCKLTHFELWLYEGTDIKYSYYVCSLSKYRRASWLIEEVLLLTPCSMRSIETARRNASSIIASVHVAEIPPSWSGHYVTLGDSYKSYQSLKEISQSNSPTHLLELEIFIHNDVKTLIGPLFDAPTSIDVFMTWNLRTCIVLIDQVRDALCYFKIFETNQRSSSLRCA